MSEYYKTKYEVLAILRENILKGLESFGLPIAGSPNEDGWLCMESEQPAFRNVDRVILVSMEHTERIGWQSNITVYNRETRQHDNLDYFIEQQTWNIKVLRRRTTKPVTDGDIPLTTEDVAGMLAAWFNRLGCNEFRVHNMANLFVQTKEFHTYKDPSDANQWVTEFPLKLQVVKQFGYETPSAIPKYGGIIGIEGTVANSPDAVTPNIGTRQKQGGGVFRKLLSVFTGWHFVKNPRLDSVSNDGDNSSGDKNGD